MVNNKNLGCTVDYYHKFPVVKEVASMSADGLVHATKVTFAEFGLPRRIILDAGPNITPETFRKFCRKLNIQHSIGSSFPYQNNGQPEECIKFSKCTIKTLIVIKILL